MDINRTWISQPIKLVMAEVHDYLTDDSGMTFEDWEPRIDETSRWYIASLDGEVAAAFWFRQVNKVTWEAHTNVRPKYWGKKAGTRMMKAGLKVALADTGAKKLIALIPENCPQVMRACEGIGFTKEGVQRQSWLKGGKLYDQIHYGLSRK